MNQPAQLAKVLQALDGIQQTFNASATGGKRVSLADLIVLAGGVGVEQAAKRAGVAVTVPFTPGRMDASQAQTDVDSFAVLEPLADGFRNYAGECAGFAETMLIDKAQLLTLSAPELTEPAGGRPCWGISWFPGAGGIGHLPLRVGRWQHSKGRDGTPL